MKYRLHLSKTHLGKREDNGTNYHTKYFDGDNQIEWELLDNSVADKFIQSYDMVADVESHQGNEVSPTNWIAWNHYSAGAEQDPIEEYRAQIYKLNEEVQYAIDNNHCDFDETFFIPADINIVLNMDDTQELILIKDCCNRIHFEFESKLNDYELQLKNTGVMMDTNDFKACLERLNRLVHIVEKGTHHKGYRNDFFVIRFNSDHVSSNFPKLTEEDYKLFQQNVENGELFSDFFTVGKDLGHAYHTGDVELITNKEVKQQSVVSGAVHFGFNRMHFGYKRESIFDSYPHYQAWCEHHRANDYGYNYWEPKYNLGRAPIGTLINETYETMRNKFKQTPYICKVELVE